jgi:hypothetical protein
MFLICSFGVKRAQPGKIVFPASGGIGATEFVTEDSSRPGRRRSVRQCIAERLENSCAMRRQRSRPFPFIRTAVEKTKRPGTKTIFGT